MIRISRPTISLFLSHRCRVSVELSARSTSDLTEIKLNPTAISDKTKKIICVKFPVKARGSWSLPLKIFIVWCQNTTYKCVYRKELSHFQFLAMPNRPNMQWWRGKAIIMNEFQRVSFSYFWFLANGSSLSCNVGWVWSLRHNRPTKPGYLATDRTELRQYHDFHPQTAPFRKTKILWMASYEITRYHSFKLSPDVFPSFRSYKTGSFWLIFLTDYFMISVSSDSW